MIYKKIVLLLISFIFLIAIISAVLDIDEDGIPDTGDKCENSELGFPVDESGCSCSQKTDCIADDNKCTDLCGTEGGMAKCNARNLTLCPSTSAKFVAGKSATSDSGENEKEITGDTYKLECQRTRTTAPKDKGDCKNEEKDCEKLKPNQGRYEFYECKQDETTGKFYEVCKELSFIKKDKITDCAKENPDGLFYYDSEKYEDGIKCEKGVFNLKCRNGEYDASKSKCPIGYESSSNNPKICIGDKSKYVEECIQKEFYIAKANKKCKEDSCPNGFVFTNCEKTSGNMYVPICVSTNPKYTYYGSKCEGNDIETNREPVNNCEFIADIKANVFGMTGGYYEGNKIEYKDYRMVADIKSSGSNPALRISHGTLSAYSRYFNEEGDIQILKDGRTIKLLDIYRGRATEWRVAICFLKEEDKKCVDNDLDNFFALAENAPAETDCGKIDCNDDNANIYPGIEKPCGALVANRAVTGSDVCKKAVSDACDKTCTLKADSTKDGTSCTMEDIADGFCLNGECVSRSCDNVYGTDFLKCGSGLVASGQFDCCAKDNFCGDSANNKKPVCAIESKELIKKASSNPPFNYEIPYACSQGKELCPTKKKEDIAIKIMKTSCCNPDDKCMNAAKGDFSSFISNYKCGKKKFDSNSEEECYKNENTGISFVCQKNIGGCFTLIVFPTNPATGKPMASPNLVYECAPGKGIIIRGDSVEGTTGEPDEQCGVEGTRNQFTKIQGKDIFSWGSLCCANGIEVGFNQPNGYPVCRTIDKSLPTSTKTKKEVLTPVLNQKVQTPPNPPTQTPSELPVEEQIKNLPATRIIPAPDDEPNIKAKFIEPDDAAFMLRDKETQDLNGVVYTFESFADIKPEEVAFDSTYAILNNPSSAEIYTYPKSNLFGLCKQTFIKEYTYTVTRDGLIADFYDEFFMNIFPGSVITEGEFTIKSYEIECPERKLPTPFPVDIKCIEEEQSWPVSPADNSIVLDCCEGLAKIEDTTTLGNFRCINCGDKICNKEAGEDNINCPVDCTEVTPPSPEHCPRAISSDMECCPGDTKLIFSYLDITTGICRTSSRYAYYCARHGEVCGDGVCYAAENRCNCPADCKS